MIVNDIEAGLAEEPQPIRNREIEIYASRIDLHISPILLVHAEIGAVKSFVTICAAYWNAQHCEWMVWS